jgi:hypothetical protein
MVNYVTIFLKAQMKNNPKSQHLTAMKNNFALILDLNDKSKNQECFTFP